MDANYNFEIIRDIYESCNGDMDKTKTTYKATFGGHVTDRHIIKALSSFKMEESDAVLDKEEVVYVDCIQDKDESDEDDIYCFEDPFAEESHKKQEMLDEKLGYCPIVYTTRLEDMHTFTKNFENIPLNGVVHQVVAESKPEFISDTFTKKTSTNKSISFSELVCKLKQFNALASSCTFHNTKETHKKTEPNDIVSNFVSTDKFHKSKEVHTMTEPVAGFRSDLVSIGTFHNSELDIKTEPRNIISNLASTDTFHKSKEVHTITDPVAGSRSDLASIGTFYNSELHIKTEPKEIVSNLASTDTNTFHKSVEVNIITEKVVDSRSDLTSIEMFQNSELDIKTEPIDVSSSPSTDMFYKSKKVHTITQPVAGSRSDLASTETFRDSEPHIIAEPRNTVSNLAGTNTFQKSKEVHTITEPVVDSRQDLVSIGTFHNSELHIKTEPKDIESNLTSADTFHKSVEVHTMTKQVVDSELDIKTEPIDVSSLPSTGTTDTFHKSKKVHTITEPVIDSLSDLASNGTFHNSELYINTEPESYLSEPLRKKIQELCKPLSITLVNCKSQLEVHKCARHKKRTFDNILMQCEKCIKYKMCRAGDVAKHRSKAKDEQSTNIYFIQRIFRVLEKTVNLWVVMKNRYLNTTEIFHIRYDLGIPTDYYHIDHVIDKDKELAFYINYFNNILEFHNCCWLKRHENIQSVYFAQMEPYLWMQAHQCSYDKCTCCCRNKILIEARHLTLNCKSESDVSLNQNREISRSNWQQLLSTGKCKNQSSWINKALEYRETSKSKLVLSVQGPPNLYSNSNTNFYCYNIRIRIGSQKKHCLVRSDGEVQCYIKLPRPHKLFGPYEEHITNSYEISKSFTTQCCCWIKYNKFLTNLMATVPDAVNFLKLPHPCPLGACKCCCCKSKIDYIPPFSFEPIKLPYTLSHTKKSTMKYKRNMEDVYNKLKTCSSKKCLSISKLNKNTAKQTKVNRLRHTEVVPVALSQTKESDINRPLSNISANATIPDAGLTVPETQDPTVNTLIATILDRFKNIRLKLNSEGQVVAELETSATHMSSEELKILSNILAHAQQQVNTLGITYNLNSCLTDPLNVAIDPVLSIPKQVSVKVLKDTAEDPQVPSCGNTNVSTTSIPPVVMPDGTNQSYSNVPQNNVSIAHELQEAKQQLQKTVDRCTDVFDAYTKLSFLKNKQYQQSLEAYSKFNQNSTLPQIKDVNSKFNQKSTRPQIKDVNSKFNQKSTRPQIKDANSKFNQKSTRPQKSTRRQIKDANSKINQKSTRPQIKDANSKINQKSTRRRIKDVNSKFNQKSTLPQIKDANSKLNQKSTLPQIKDTYSLNALVKQTNVVNERLESSKTPHTRKPSILRKRKPKPESILESVLSSKKPKQATDIKIVNVHSQSSSESSVQHQQPPQVSPFTAVMGQGIPPGLLCNTAEAPMLVNPDNNQYMPQMLLNGAFVQPVIIPRNFVNGIALMPDNNSFHKLPFNSDPIDLTNLPGKDAADDCILGV